MKQSGSRRDEASRLGEDLRQAVSAFVRTIRRDADTPRSAQAETLALLDREESLNIAALAKHRQVTHQTMRVVARQMEIAGLIMRTPDPHDRRSQLFSLSVSGRRELADERAKRAATITAMIRDELSSDERAILRQAIPLLERLNSAAK
ncbi:MarR family winged helix-turn-helix transcriptional regulator [Novosphingobium sp. AP12]|uniref:MarR family winged helix-turn-helix transcriptional regulator n=1 Tax=Novosphingobium sp. AP12 TaxID=1144305 RepID=UPI00027200B9|nr:MarR family transcriptional regulator [Novosphingobium sp. AP12]EJL22749.1 transcriptional regulator [Novosphingobium sp. AP12]